MTTTRSKLSRIPPRSETHWRAIAAAAHRSRGYPGDEAHARTHESQIYGIRQCQVSGSSRQPRNCPRCEKRGVRVWLIWMGGTDRCGNCLWPGEREDAQVPGL